MSKISASPTTISSPPSAPRSPQRNQPGSDNPTGPSLFEDQYDRTLGSGTFGLSAPMAPQDTPPAEQAALSNASGTEEPIVDGGTAAPATGGANQDFAGLQPPARGTATSDIPAPKHVTAPDLGRPANDPNSTGEIAHAADLAKVVGAGYNKGKYGPVAVAPAAFYLDGNATGGLLATISGTEGGTGQATGPGQYASAVNGGSSLYKDALASIRREADLFQKTSGGGKPPIILSGHSLGGMVAQQVAAELKNEGHDVRTVTYGSGRTTHSSDPKHTLRFYSGTDPVPWMTEGSLWWSNPLNPDYQGGKGWLPPMKLPDLGWNPLKWPGAIVDAAVHGHSLDSVYGNAQRYGDPKFLQKIGVGKIKFAPADRNFYEAPLLGFLGNTEGQHVPDPNFEVVPNEAAPESE